MKKQKIVNKIYIIISILIWYLYFFRFLQVMINLIAYDFFIYVFLPSILLGYLIVKVLIKKHKNYYLTTSHENSHQIMAILLFSPPIEFHVNKDGSGNILYKKKFFSRIISYAPYFFFPLPLLLIIISLFLRSNTFYIFIFIYGLAIGMRFSVILKDLKTYRIQTDITKYGIKISLITISSFLLLSFGILFSYLLSPLTIDGIKFFLLL